MGGFRLTWLASDLSDGDVKGLQMWKSSLDMRATCTIVNRPGFPGGSIC